MPEDQQAAVVSFLAGLGPSQTIETHGAIVVLLPDEALKIKRAVRYDYLDFSTLELRHRMLERELELNAPAAPGLYRDVVPITLEADGSLAISGSGTVAEWVLRMARFPAEAELSHLADIGKIDDALATELGQAIAAYHAQNPVRDEDGAALIAEILDELETVFSTMRAELGPAAVDQILIELRAEHEVQAPLLRQRSAAGWVRRCHGDLHLHNIVMWEGKPALFDALEFDERLGTCDVLYDLAFLLMDLAHRGLGRAANRVLNTYLFDSGSDDQIDGLAALPLFLAVRAAIRAMVDVQTARFSKAPDPLIREARGFLSQASRFLSPPPPQLIAIGGLSGTGKTTLANALAHRFGAFPGAFHIRSDLERKAHFGVPPMTRLPQAAYAPDISAAIYSRMEAKTERALRAGHAVLLDAVHGSPEERDMPEQLARRLNCPFSGIWLEAETETRVARVTDRRGDASDADARVAARQSSEQTGPISWTRLSSAGDLAPLVTKACETIVGAG